MAIRLQKIRVPIRKEIFYLSRELSGINKKSLLRVLGASAVRFLFWNEMAGECERYLLTEIESPSAPITLLPVRSPR